MFGRLPARAGATLTLLGALLAATPAHATALYTYTGNPFTTVGVEGPVTPADPYTTSDRVTIVFELDEPLAPNVASLTYFFPLSFTFSDGVNTITEATALTWRFRLTTDASGNITAWRVSAQESLPLGSGGTLRTIESVNDSLGWGVFDRADDYLCGPLGSALEECTAVGYHQAASNTEAPGAWQLRIVSPVPEPATTMLVGAALVGLVARRRAGRMN